jgi:hypothetical protein
MPAKAALQDKFQLRAGELRAVLLANLPNA